MSSCPARRPHEEVPFIHLALGLNRHLERLVPAIVIIASCTFCSLAQSQSPEKESVDAFFLAFRQFLAITSAGVDECGNRFPERKDGYLTAYQRARDDNLAVFVKTESSEDFPELLQGERSRASMETDGVMAEYCAELPRYIDVAAKYASKLRFVLPNP